MQAIARFANSNDNSKVIIAVFMIGVCNRLVHAIEEEEETLFLNTRTTIRGYSLRTSKPRDLWAILILCERVKSQCITNDSPPIANTA